MTEIKKDHSERMFLAGMVASMFCWGLSWSSGKILTAYALPLEIAFFRFAITFASLLIILFLIREKLSIKLSGLPDLIGAAAFIALYTFLFFKGLSVGKAGAGGVLVTTLNPVVSYVIMVISKRQLPGRKQVIGLVVGVMGGSILLQVWNNLHGYFQEGNGYFLLASISWAILSLFTSKSSRYGSPVVFSLWMYALCTLFLFFPVGTRASIQLIQHSDWKFWLNLIFSGTVTTAIATTFYFVATTKLGAGRASSYIFLVPLSAALGSWVFLGEIPQAHTIIGGMFGIVAVYLINSKPG